MSAENDRFDRQSKQVRALLVVFGANPSPVGSGLWHGFLAPLVWVSLPVNRERNHVARAKNKLRVRHTYIHT